MATTQRHVSPIITVLLVATWVALWLAWLGFMVFGVPSYERIFSDFRFKLPYHAIVTVNVSRWCVKYSYVVIILLVVFGLPLVAGISAFFRHGGLPWWLSWLWFLAVLGFPLLILTLMYGSMFVSHAQLLTALQEGH